MPITINKADGLFRNELIYAVDAKSVNLDNLLVNLYLLLNYNGSRPRSIGRRGEKDTTINSLIKRIKALEVDNNGFKGFSDNSDIAEAWLRTNIINMVHRGDIEKENVSSIRPIHLEAYKERNPARNRDYFTSDQVYLMLGAKPSVREELKNFLQDGWDENTKEITANSQLDVDSLGILHLIKKSNPKFVESNSSINKIRPILMAEAELFCDDISRLLVYKKSIPRSVLIEYLKNIISFHLTLYTHKLIQFLPEMVDKGTFEVAKEFSFVVDTTNNLDSSVSELAIEDASKTYNMLFDYIKATFKVNSTLRFKELNNKDSDCLKIAFETLRNKDQAFELYFKYKWDSIFNSLDEDDQQSLIESTEFEESYFDKYTEILTKVKGAYQYKYTIQYLDQIAQKNSEAKILSQGRSKKHPRRFSLGSKLLETLIQILVLETDINSKFKCRSLFVEELLDLLRSRYGIIIDGTNEERFKEADITTLASFKENVDALKEKLRQIGFYNDLSDAYILQKIKPRYDIV